RCRLPPALRPVPTRRSSDLRRERSASVERRLRTRGQAHRVLPNRRGEGEMLELVTVVVCAVAGWLGVSFLIALGLAYREARNRRDRKSTRLNSSHVKTSYAV